jgi:hypothetical protein
MDFNFDTVVPGALKSRVRFEVQRSVSRSLIDTAHTSYTHQTVAASVTLTFVKSAQAARSPAGTPTDADAYCEANADLRVEPASLCNSDRV